MVVALSSPASGALPKPPVITATTTTFTIPSPGTSTWYLRLWSHGNLEGSQNATSGTLTVDVPSTSDCAFQADVSVLTVSGTRYFYSGARATVPGCGPVTQTIAGHILLCTTAGAQTTTEETGGTLSTTGPQVLSQSNPLGPTKVPFGSYTMTATAPSGFELVACGGAATIGPEGDSATEPVTVPAGGQGVGNFYVIAPVPAGSLSGGSGPPGGLGSGKGPPTKPGTSAPAVPVSHGVPTLTKIASPKLALTGLDTAPLLIVGLLALVLGTLSLLTSRTRRRALVVDRRRSRARH
ncbi:MAG TPA: hypothetical protein VID75_02120 [Acidimicrobiales bacterium]